MDQVRIITSFSTVDLEDCINKFLTNSKVHVKDIKFNADYNNNCFAAMIIYQ